MSFGGVRYDKSLEHQDQTPLGKLQQQYWTTKQKVLKKLGKGQDEYIVLSDADLDAKLDLFGSVKQSSNELLRIIDHYQDKICELSMAEAEMSHFLKEYSVYDKTRAGKMMSSVSKAQNFSSQQRMSLRVPLTRLYNEVETFRYRAITDTWLTIRKMEQTRTEYRGALLWMKDVSNELDPDTHKKLEKFRRVQAQVKQTKMKFDRNKVDVQQKIDLLLASRCNMFSNVLFNYQQCLLEFWQKSSKTMNAIADAFKGYQYYEFNIIKDLVEPSKKLAELSEPNQTSDTLDQANTNEDDKNEKNQNTLIQFDEKNDDQLLDVSKYNEDNIIEMIDMLTNNEASNLNDQLKELETLEIAKNKLPKQKNEPEIDEYDENLLKNIINNSNDEFEKEWQAVFGGGKDTAKSAQQDLQQDGELISNLDTQLTQLELINTSLSTYLPSQLLTSNTSHESILKPQSNSKPQVKQQEESNTKKPKKDLSTWYNLFADLDPIQNPDAIGSKVEIEEERNC